MSARPARSRARTLGLALGYAWSLPTVVLCLPGLLALWALGQLRPVRLHAGAWEWTVVPGSWFAFRYRAWAGTALAWTLLFAPGCESDPAHAAHERRHLWQSLLLGPLYLPVYGLLLLVYGYHRHPMERDARAHER